MENISLPNEAAPSIHPNKIVWGEGMAEGIKLLSDIAIQMQARMPKFPSGFIVSVSPKSGSKLESVTLELKMAEGMPKFEVRNIVYCGASTYKIRPYAGCQFEITEVKPHAEPVYMYAVVRPMTGKGLKVVKGVCRYFPLGFELTYLGVSFGLNGDRMGLPPEYEAKLRMVNAEQHKVTEANLKAITNE